MIEMRGPANLDELVGDLDELASGRLERDLQEALEESAEEIVKAVAESAELILPHRGGLAAQVARSRIVTRVTRNGVTLTAVASSINRGIVRHPVFGRRGSTVTQRVRPGYFSRPFVAAEDAVQDRLTKVLERIIARLDR